MADWEIDARGAGGESVGGGSVVGDDYGDGVCGGRVVWGDCPRGDLGGGGVGDFEVVCY